MTDLSRNLRTSAGLLALTLLMGTLGFIACGRDVWHAAYQTVVVLTTVGMEGPESESERVWSMFLMVAGVGVVLYATGNVVAFFVDGQIRAVFGRRQLMHTIDKLKGHYIIVGFGRMGRALCTTLQYKDVPFVLVESDEKRIQDADEMGYLYVRGDGMLEQSLIAAGIDRATGLATCLPNDASNVFVTLTARGVNERMTIIARAEAIETELKLKRAGATRVICPPVLGAGRVTDMLLNPVAEEMLELDGHWPDLELSKLSMHHFPTAIDRPLRDIFEKVGMEVMVAAIVSVDGTRVFNPEPDVTLRAGDEIVVVGPHGSLEQTVGSLRGEKAA